MADQTTGDQLFDEDMDANNQSGGQFGSPQGADPSEAGQKGAETQSRDDKAEGGRRSGGKQNS